MCYGHCSILSLWLSSTLHTLLYSLLCFWYYQSQPLDSSYQTLHCWFLCLFCLSAPLHWMTFPSLSDRTPLWTPSKMCLCVAGVYFKALCTTPSGRWQMNLIYYHYHYWKSDLLNLIYYDYDYCKSDLLNLIYYHYYHCKSDLFSNLCHVPTRQNVKVSA